MNLLPIEEIKDGMCLAKPIYTKNTERVLLKEGTIFTKPIINILKNWDISKVYVYNIKSDITNGLPDNNSNNINSQDDIKLNIKTTAINILINILNCSSTAICDIKWYSKNNLKKHLYKPIVNILEDIIEFAFSKKNIVEYLMIIKDTDDYTFRHSINVAAIALILGINLDLERLELYDLYIGAILHDIGKALVPVEYIKKKSSLTDSEFQIVKQHTIKGYQYLCLDHNMPSAAKNIILQHHERFDGLGYPYGVTGHQIHKLARIVSIADIYDALISDRPYRKAVSVNEAMEYILACGNTYLDYEMVVTFSRLILPYSKGMRVKLSNGYEGIVEETFPSYPLRPLIRVLNDNTCLPIKYIDLRNELNIVIEKVITGKSLDTSN